MSGLRVFRKNLLVSVALVAGAFAPPAWAEDADAGAVITVLATGYDLPVDQAGQAVTVINGAEIASVQGADITRVLGRLPGVSLDRTGPLGSATSVFVRGANSEQLLVLVDGVRVADVAAPSGGFDFGGLLSGGISQIQLLRGSNSVVWGSDAIGGVMAITTAEVNGAEGSVEGGSHGTVSTEASVGRVRDDWALGVSGGYYHSDGIPTEPAVVNGGLDNGFDQWHISARGRVTLAAGLDLVASGRWVDSKLAIDSYGAAPDYAFGNFGDWQRTRAGSGRVGLDYTGATALGATNLKAGVAYVDTRRDYVDPPSGTLVPDYSTDGGVWHVDGSGHFALPAKFTLDVGADGEWSSFVDSYDTPAHDSIASGHALLGWHGDGLNLAVGERVDSHSTFGTHWTFGANGSARLVGDVRLRASYGEGFKAPTLYQLLAQDYGNDKLVPETSKSYDVALEKGERDGVLHGALTWFHRDTTELIEFIDCYSLVLGGCAAQPYGYYLNIGQARSEGVELEGDWRATGAVTVHASYTHVVSTDRSGGSATFGKALARRPRDVGSLSGDWVTAWRGLALGADLRASGPSWDDAANTVRLSGYATVDLRASVPVGARFELFGRVENVGDARYQTAAGYGAYGRSVYAGLRAKL
jgi:vitamin B12 transporter